VHQVESTKKKQWTASVKLDHSRTRRGGSISSTTIRCACAGGGGVVKRFVALLASCLSSWLLTNPGRVTATCLVLWVTFFARFGRHRETPA
jgi:hypothetical protein